MTQIRCELEFSFDGSRSLRSIMEQGFAPPTCPDLDLESALPRFVHQFEKADEVGLPGPIRPNEDVERTKIDRRIPDRFPPSESQAGQLGHFTPSLRRAGHPFFGGI
ncbi:MAG TPA: hypothetical protein VH682_28345 [Gemmataceae bacterium]|jgi:hypothetical protein